METSGAPAQTRVASRRKVVRGRGTGCDGCVVMGWSEGEAEGERGKASGGAARVVRGVRAQKRDAFTYVPSWAPGRAPKKDAFDAPQVGAQVDAFFWSPRNFQVSGRTAAEATRKEMCSLITNTGGFSEVSGCPRPDVCNACVISVA